MINGSSLRQGQARDQSRLWPEGDSAGDVAPPSIRRAQPRIAREQRTRTPNTLVGRGSFPCPGCGAPEKKQTYTDEKGRTRVLAHRCGSQPQGWKTAVPTASRSSTRKFMPRDCMARTEMVQVFSVMIHLLLNRSEDGDHLTFQKLKLHLLDGTLRVEDYISRRRQKPQISADQLTQPSLDAISVDGFSQRLRYRETHAGTTPRQIRPVNDSNGCRKKITYLF